MRAKDHAGLEAGEEKKIRIEKICDGQDASALGAFPYGASVLFRVTLPRKLGFAAVVMRLSPDGGGERDLPLAFVTREGDADVYERALDTAGLCADAEGGLFFYQFLFLRGYDTRFSDTSDNLHFRLAESPAGKFRLLVYRRDFTTPEWFRGGTMYHVFLDRFCRADDPRAVLRSGTTLDPDWEGGVPQYAKKPGDPLANDVFFGGNLAGITEKLDYLSSLGVTVLYLSPVFEAASNHRYDTGDYEKIDPLLGGEEAFSELIAAAHAKGIRVILDGVFNHTGDDSRYFNRRGRYPGIGAYQSKDSPFAGWYHFEDFPDRYESWWGIEILPRLNHSDPACLDYFTGQNGIAAKWLRAGADGWRLDVADELSDPFLDAFRKTVKKETGGEGVIIGEVWENAVDKIAYGTRRRYFGGRQLDSVMNYPFRNAVLAFLLYKDAHTFARILTELYATYPPCVSNSLMNVLGTHDTERILTLLGDGGSGEGLSNTELSRKRLTPEQYETGKRLLLIASTLQFTVFGVPSVYYGDEAGTEGYHDPFCRMPFPWGREDAELLAHYRRLGALRKAHPALKNGSFRFLEVSAHAFAFERTEGDDRVTVAANMGSRAVRIGGLHVAPGTVVVE